MLSVECSTCGLTINVVGSEDETAYLVGEQSEYWPDKYRCSCGREMSRTEGSLGTVYDLSPVEFFHFLSGVGLPFERHCSRAVLEEVFQQSVKKLHGYEVRGAQTFRLEAIEMADGTKVYLGASPKGAVIYRIAPPPNNTKKVLDG